MPDLTVPDPAPTWEFIASDANVPLESLLVANGKEPNASYAPPDPGSVVHIPVTTNVRAAPNGQVTVASGPALLNHALEELATQARNFGVAFIDDATVRQNYVDRIAQMSEEWKRSANEGSISWEAAAKEANAARNAIMEESRAITSSIGRATAEATKATGLTLEEAIDKGVQKLFPGRSFGDLAQAERRAVFNEVIEASGRSSPRFTSAIPKMRVMGRACLVFTVAIAAYNIWSAKNHTRAALHEGFVIGGGALGGALAGAATGLVCGPAAPFCSTALFIVGGIAGSLAGEATDVALDDQLNELSNWLVD